MSLQKTQEITQFLDGILQPELHTILEQVHSKEGYFQLPDERHVLLSPSEVSRVVALAANKYAQSVRFAGIARAQFKIAEANYKFKFKTNMGSGRNEAQREAVAMEAALEEYEQMTYLSSIVELAESMELANRVASESARRMLLGSNQTELANNRFDGHSDSLVGSDFAPY